MLQCYASVRLHIALNLVLLLAVRARRQCTDHCVDARGGSRLKKPSLKLHQVTGLELVHHLTNLFGVASVYLVGIGSPRRGELTSVSDGRTRDHGLHRIRAHRGSSRDS
jgi:hypothetical protein